MGYYVVISVIALLIVGLLLIRFGKKGGQREMSNFAKLSFFMVLAGVLLGDNPWVGYTLMGGGIVIALVDIKNRL